MKQNKIKKIVISVYNFIVEYLTELLILAVLIFD